MQTLISVFDDPSTARRALERLVKEGFAREDLHLQEGRGGVDTVAPAEDQREVQGEGTLTGTHAGDSALGERTMATAEREVAVDKGVVEMLANFFVGLFGDRGHVHARRYTRAVGAGRSMVLVDARTDHEAEAAAVILHDMGATDVDDHHFEENSHDVRKPLAGVHLYKRDQQPGLRELAGHRHLREESIMASPSAQRMDERRAPVDSEQGTQTEQREERAIAASRTDLDKDRPL